MVITEESEVKQLSHIFTCKHANQRVVYQHVAHHIKFTYTQLLSLISHSRKGVKQTAQLSSAQSSEDGLVFSLWQTTVFSTRACLALFTLLAVTAPESDETTPRLTQRQTTKFNSTQKIWLRTYDCAVSSQYRCFEFAPIGPFSALTGPFKLLNHCIRKYFKFAAVGLFRAERVRVYMYLSVCIVWSL